MGNQKDEREVTGEGGSSGVEDERTRERKE